MADSKEQKAHRGKRGTGRRNPAAVRPVKPLSPSAERILAAYRVASIAETPSPAELGRTLGIKLQIVEGLVRHLVARGEVVALPGGWYVGREAVATAAATLAASGLETVDLKTCKALLGLSRKLLIPLLQHLAATGAARREGDRMRMLGAARGEPGSGLQSSPGPAVSAPPKGE